MSWATSGGHTPFTLQPFDFWSISRSAATTPSTPNAPTNCSNAYAARAWTAATKTRCANSTARPPPEILTMMADSLLARSAMLLERRSFPERTGIADVVYTTHRRFDVSFSLSQE